jgi:hypothetical protein
VCGTGVYCFPFITISVGVSPEDVTQHVERQNVKHILPVLHL